jgi:5-methylcytosine-specific restriction endonuclease McrA
VYDRALNKKNRNKRRIVEQRYRDKHPEKVQALNKQRGQQIKEQYHTDEAFRTKTLARTSAYSKTHRDIMNKAINAWHKAHKDQMRPTRRAYRQRRLATDPTYRDQLRAGQRKHYLQHPESALENARVRRARQRGAPRVEKINRAAIIARDQSICHLCGLVVPPEEMSLDHLIPLARGGSHTPDNLAVAHLTCNKRRGTKPLAS